MATFRWPGSLDPFTGLRYMQRELERLMGTGGESRAVGGGTFPPLNIYNGQDAMMVLAEVPGLKQDQLDLSITGETLVIRGSLPEAEEDGRKYHRRERGAGEFTRTIILPDRVEAEEVQANLKNGILTITLPKSESAKPRQIKVS